MLYYSNLFNTKHKPMQQNNQSPSLPLWKLLNEKRTQGEVKATTETYLGFYELKFPDHETLCTVPKVNVNERYIANAEFTALAVNHLASLAEALTNLLSSYKADFYNITGGELNNTEAVLQAKEALNKIS